MKKIFNAVATSTLMLLAVVPLSSNAGTTVKQVKLECCIEDECPTKYVSPGEEKVTQSVTFKKQIVPFSNEELTIPVSGDNGYMDWKKSIRKQYPNDKETWRYFFRASRPGVIAMCSGGELNTKTISGGKGRTLTCSEGNGIIVSSGLKCEDSETGPYSIVEISKTKKDEDELEKKMNELKMELNVLNKKHDSNLRSIEFHTRRVNEIDNLIFGSGSFN